MDSYEKKESNNIIKETARMVEVAAANNNIKIMGWYNIEKDILRAAIMKYEICSWEQIKIHFQINPSNRMTQRIVGKQSLAEYHGVNLDIIVVRVFNLNKYKGVYYIEQEKITFTRSESDELKEANRQRFGLEREYREQLCVGVFK